MIAELWQRLNGGYHSSGGVAAFDAAIHGVPRQRFAQHMYQSRIADQVGATPSVLASKDRVQAAEGLTGAGNAGHEHNQASAIYTDLLDFCKYCVCRGVQIACVTPGGSHVRHV